jgi:Ca2+-binding RTX toxin-like protein
MNTLELVQRLFDADHYLQKNPDALQSGLEAWQHFVLIGLGEGRDPGPFFNASYYLGQYPDVAAAGVLALTHFLEHGLYEGRVPTDLFDAEYYLAENTDVAASSMTPFFHFMCHGMEEGRAPSATGEASSYIPNGEAASELDAVLLLLGTDGADQLIGGNNDDVLVGRGGNDTLFGGDGQDIFGFGSGFGEDTIQDFSVSEDILRMTSLGIGSYEDLVSLADVAVTGNDTSIAFSDGSSVTLIGVSDPSAIEFMPLPLI